MLTTQERQIGDHLYAVTQLPGFKSLRMLRRLSGLFLPAISEAVGGAVSSKTNMSDIKIENLGRAFSVLFDKLSENELESITRDLLAAATVDGKPLVPIFDVHFQGRPDEILQVLLFAIEVNYARFLHGPLAKLRALGAASNSTSPNTSAMSGQHGGS